MHANWSRGLLKLSGELLGGPSGRGLDHRTLCWIADELVAVTALGRALAVVVGAGNILRGATSANADLERIRADAAGMLGTGINALVLESYLRKRGAATRIHSAAPMGGLVGAYDRERAEDDLRAGRILLLAGGTGNPLFSTDTAAALRAAELGCDLMLKATKVDGVYDRDPEAEADKSAPPPRRFATLSFQEALARGLGVLDQSAFALLAESGTPLAVFALNRSGDLLEIARGRGRCTLLAVNLPTRFAASGPAARARPSRSGKTARKTAKKRPRSAPEKPGRKKTAKITPKSRKKKP